MFEYRAYFWLFQPYVTLQPVANLLETKISAIQSGSRNTEGPTDRLLHFRLKNYIFKNI